MPRSATTADVFNAVGEPRRRQIISLLAQGERSVNDVADSLRLNQPQTSKHLKVLKEVGVVRMRGSGQQRLYSLNGTALKPIHDWVMTFAQFWRESYDRLDEYLQELQAHETKHD
ncbi:MAG: ArsR/SmtB family transcription factor [Planctomycetales bacterium]